MQKILQRLILMLALLNAFNLYASSSSLTSLAPLPAEKAFALTLDFSSPTMLNVTWQIAPGYYLYTKRMHFDFIPDLAADIAWPQGQWHENKKLGRYLAYTNNVEIPISFKAQHTVAKLEIEYQGCSDSGFCYPPMEKVFNLDFVQQTVSTAIKQQNSTISSLKSLLTDQQNIQSLLSERHPVVLLLIFLGLGLLLAFTPCVLPMVPILTSIIIGQQHAPKTKKAFLLSFTYVLGIALTYAVAGLIAASLGNSLQVWLQQPITIAVVSSIFIFLALSLFGLYELRFSRRWHNKIAAWSDKHEGGTYLGVFFMGVLSTLVVSPCVTAPLVGVLIYIGQTGNLFFGASALFVMGFGMGIPLLLIGMSAGKWLPKSGPWMKAVKELFGIFMVAMAIWLLSRIIPLVVTQLLFGSLLLGTAFFVGWYLPRLIRMRKLNHAIGVGIAVIGMFYIFGAMQSLLFNVQQVSSLQDFAKVENISQLKEQLATACKARKPVLLDFYADWCESCVSMDKHVFDSPTVQEALKGFKLIRVDLSTMTAGIQTILKEYEVIAPPTVLFFTPRGKELNAKRIIGELDKEEFLARIPIFTGKQSNKQEAQAC